MTKYTVVSNSIVIFVALMMSYAPALSSLERAVALLAVAVIIPIWHASIHTKEHLATPLQTQTGFVATSFKLQRAGSLTYEVKQDSA